MVLLAVVGGAARADTLYVSADAYGTIAGALEDASDGDVIQVRASDYETEPPVVVTGSVTIGSLDGDEVAYPPFIVIGGALTLSTGSIEEGDVLTDYVSTLAVYDKRASVLVYQGSFQTDAVRFTGHEGYGVVLADSTVWLANSTLSGFDAYPAIQAVSVASDTYLYLSGVTMEENLAGAVAFQDDLDRRAQYNELGVEDSTFRYNSRENGSDIDVSFVDLLWVTGSTFEGGAARGYGGSIYAENSVVSVQTSSFTDYEAGSGGALWVSGTGGSLTTWDVDFESNVALSADGGGGDIGTLVVDASLTDTHSKDAAAAYGGSVYVTSGGLGIYDSSFEGATAYAGGAVFLYYGNGTSYVDGSTFCDNVASDAYGGGAILSYYAALYLSESVFQANSAPYGAAVQAAGGDTAVFDSTFVDHADGGAFYASDAYVYFGNNIVTGSYWGAALADTATTSFAGFNLWYENTVDSEGLTTTGGDVYADPLFSTTFSRSTCGTLPTLQHDSPAIDVGIPSDTFDDEDGTRSDIGAFGPDSGTPDTGDTGDTGDAAPVDLDADGWDSTLDCDDGDASVSPGADDTLGDDIDQDCDGVAASAVAHGSCGCGAGTGASAAWILVFAALVRRRS